jgi:hypothetical protein
MLLALIALICISLACNLASQEMSLIDLRMAYDEEGERTTTQYSTTDVFYVVGELNNAPAGTLLEAEWRAARIDGYEPDELIYEQEINDFTEEEFSGTVYFQLSNDAGWPTGEYRVDILLDGTLIESLVFSVR